MANELVVRRTQLPQAQLAARAAQYVRMSTDHQRYSIENQAAVIATYAQLHGLTIVGTYRDEGETGLKIKNRAGLTQLLRDVQSGHADFSHILVYDISRWGRFQDTDESAHYEFLCKRAGIRVAYCAEQFENDGSLLSNIMIRQARHGCRIQPRAFCENSRGENPTSSEGVPSRWPYCLRSTERAG